MSEPFEASASLSFPPDDGKPLATAIQKFCGTFDKRVDLKLKLTGTGTYTVDLSAVGAPGAKVLFVEYECTKGTQNQQPVQLHANPGEGSVDFELSPGGFILHVNPTPAAGIVAMTIEYAADANLRVRALG